MLMEWIEVLNKVFDTKIGSFMSNFCKYAAVNIWSIFYANVYFTMYAFVSFSICFCSGEYELIAEEYSVRSTEVIERVPALRPNSYPALPASCVTLPTWGGTSTHREMCLCWTTRARWRWCARC